MQLAVFVLAPSTRRTYREMTSPAAVSWTRSKGSQKYSKIKAKTILDHPMLQLERIAEGLCWEADLVHVEIVVQRYRFSEVEET